MENRSSLLLFLSSSVKNDTGTRPPSTLDEGRAQNLILIECLRLKN